MKSFVIDRYGRIVFPFNFFPRPDAVSEGVINRPMRVFAPGFGPGAVGGYAVLRAAIWT